MLYKVIKAFVTIDGIKEKTIVLTPEMREYLENHPTRELYKDDYVDDNLFTIDIDETTVKEVKSLAKTDSEKEMVKEIKDAEYMNIDICVYIGSN